MNAIRVREAALLLGVSDDTLRRWIAAGELTAVDDGGVQAVDGAELAALARRRAGDPPNDGSDVLRSARNRFTGLVT